MKNFQFGVLPPEHTSVFFLDDDGDFPNNEQLPVIVYEHALQISNEDLAERDIEGLLADNRWHHPWRGQVQDFHHYHSTAHEVLIALKGRATLMLGGPRGTTLQLNPGDVILIPAGVAHKAEESSADFECIGAYPEDQLFDMNYGKPEERSKANENIQQLPLPEADPVYGIDGPLVFHWKLDRNQKP
ncbi:MAG: cupin domain-containing protein [Chitinophagaceae bacterium]|nr:MAG: cupin domain-containing protein [Chitinophagaceae bacterium]